MQLNQLAKRHEQEERGDRKWGLPRDQNSRDIQTEDLHLI